MYKDCQYYPDKIGVGTVAIWNSPWRYNVTNVVDHFCIPSGSDFVDAATLEQFKKAFFTNVYGQKIAVWFWDIAKSWKVLAVSAATAFVLAYLYLFVIRCVGGIIIYISIATIILGLAGGGGYCFWFSTTFAADDPFRNYVAWASYVIWGLCALTILVVLCCFGAIKLGIAIFKTTA